MPISKHNMQHYPGGSIKSPEWLAIRARIQQRARFRCEECGVRDKAWGWRDQFGKFHYVNKTALKQTGYDRPPFKLKIYFDETSQPLLVKVIQIVCTTAHLDNELTDHSDKNLRFWCQRCHLRHDYHQHKAASHRSRRARNALRDMFEGHQDGH